MSEKVSNAFYNAYRRVEYRSWVHGLLGKPNGSGGYTVAVADRPGHYFVRISQQGVLTVTTARAALAIPARANLPVRMRLEQGTGYVIHALDTTATLDAALANDVVNVYGTPQHTHDLDSGLTYLIEAQRMEPGLVRPAGGWFVTIEPFRYYYGGSWQTYPGATISLVSNKPSTSGKHRLVVVCVDPATNTETAVNGSDADYATTLNQESIDAISIGDKYPLAAVLIRADDSNVATQSKYLDARGWLNYADSLTFNDAEGQPADVTDTAADGTSDYAARRDHVHAIDDVAIVDIIELNQDTILFDDAEGQPADIGTAADGTSIYAARRDHAHAIADGSLANAKLANMAQATVKGRAAGAGSGVPQDLSAGQLAAIVGTGALDVDTSALGNVGTGEDTIASYTVPANTLANNGDSIWFEAFGTAANNGNSKTLKVYFGSAEIVAAADTDWGLEWTLRGRIIRTGTATQKAYVNFSTSAPLGTGSLAGGAGVNMSVTEDETGTITLAITAEATSDNDLVCEGMIAGYTPAP